MFVDLDWPLNASSLLSASAELLVLFCYNLMHVRCFGLVVSIAPPFRLAASVWFCGAVHEKRRGEQKWFLAFRLYIGSFPCAQLPGPVHTARLGRVCFRVFSLGLYFVYLFVLLEFVHVSPSFCVSLGNWDISLTGFGAGVTIINEPPRAFSTSTIAWVRS